MRMPYSTPPKWLDLGRVNVEFSGLFNCPLKLVLIWPDLGTQIWPRGSLSAVETKPGTIQALLHGDRLRSPHTGRSQEPLDASLTAIHEKGCTYHLHQADI